MRKLGKKLQLSAMTVESFYSCYCSIQCNCTCATSDTFYNNYREGYHEARIGPGPS